MKSRVTARLVPSIVLIRNCHRNGYEREIRISARLGCKLCGRFRCIIPEGYPFGSHKFDTKMNWTSRLQPWPTETHARAIPQADEAYWSVAERLNEERG